jgi:hypothetical protein
MGITPASQEAEWFWETLPEEEAAKVMDAIRKLGAAQEIHRWLKWMDDQDRSTFTAVLTSYSHAAAMIEDG